MTDNETLGVNIGACQCPGTPHENGDEVHLRKRLGLAAGVQLQRRVVDANANSEDTDVLAGKLAEAYIRVGVVAWNLTDEAGKPVPVNQDTLQTHLLDDFARSIEVADAADGIYMDTVLGPLVKRVAESSRSTTTNGSTSPTANGAHKPQKQSKRSSTSTTQTDATETTSP
jgi:hypothetical protein